MKTILAALLFGACSAQAYTIDFSLTDVLFEVIDLTPDDGIAPFYTVTWSEGDPRAPIEYHDASPNEPAPAPNSGPLTVRLEGYLSPGTALHWRGTSSLMISVIDVDNGLDIDTISATFGVGAYPIDYGGLYDQSDVVGLLGSGSTYQHLYSGGGGSTFEVLIRDTVTPEPVPFELIYSLTYRADTYFSPRPVPEPAASAGLLTGLALLAASLGFRRRPA